MGATHQVKKFSVEDVTIGKDTIYGSFPSSGVLLESPELAERMHSARKTASFTFRT